MIITVLNEFNRLNNSKNRGLMPFNLQTTLQIWYLWCLWLSLTQIIHFCDPIVKQNQKLSELCVELNVD